MEKISEIWQGAGILLYTKDMNDNNSVGINKGNLPDVLQYLKNCEGFTSINNSITLKKTFKGITLSDYQGRHLFLNNKQIRETITIIDAELKKVKE